MTNVSNRFNFKGEWNFEGKGNVIDNQDGTVYEAILNFRVAQDGIEIIVDKVEGVEGTYDTQINLTPSKSDNVSIWEMVIFNDNKNEGGI